MTNIYSSGKSVAAILMAIKRDKQQLEYGDKVSKSWPEFAKNGKEDILIEDVLRHDAGLNKFSKKIDLEWCSTENIKKNVMGEIIEDEPKQFFPETERCYHALTKDWITNEIFRRVDEKQRTMDEFMREEIHPKIGEGIHIALNDDEMHKCYNFNFVSNWMMIKHMATAEQSDRFSPNALSDWPRFFK